jgi:rhodanese-related sulfurtransferase
LSIRTYPKLQQDGSTAAFAVDVRSLFSIFSAGAHIEHRFIKLIFGISAHRSELYRGGDVALALRRKGIPRVWILDGGLKAWIKQGYPVTTNLSDPKERAMSLGIHVSDWNAGS